MHDFCYVSKKEAAPVKAELLDIIHEVQDIVRDDFTFQFTFIGSSSRNMITYDRKSNIGFDFDVNIEVNDDDENYEPKEIRTIIRKALDKVARQYGYDYCEDSTRVLTIKKKDRPNSRIIHSCDFAIVNNCGGGRQQYIRYNKDHQTYTCVTVETAGQLTAEQEADLKDWITGQNSDGLGEGFEHQEINIDSYSSSGRICVSFWHSGDDYFVDNEDEFAERLEQGFNLGGM